MFVAEGTSPQKLDRIRHHAYLSKAERSLTNIGGSLFERTQTRSARRFTVLQDLHNPRTAARKADQPQRQSPAHCGAFFLPGIQPLVPYERSGWTVEQSAQAVSPRSPSTPSFTMIGTIANAETGSAHHQPSRVFSATPARAIIDR